MPTRPRDHLYAIIGGWLRWRIEFPLPLKGGG